SALPAACRSARCADSGLRTADSGLHGIRRAREELQVLEGPEGEPGLAHDILRVDRAEEMGILAGIAVVAEDEVFVRAERVCLAVCRPGIGGQLRDVVLRE